MNRAAALLTAIARWGTMTALYPAEWFLLTRLGNLALTPAVFLLGPPRSGTSFLYEMLITQFRFAYFSNSAHRFYMTPVAASALARPLMARWHGEFRSSYGHIPGWGAPSEGGWIWDRWFKADLPALDTTNANREITELRRTICAMSRVFGAPFLNKNVMHCNHIQTLNALFPDCLFVEVRRDPIDNVVSILHARERDGGPKPNAHGWWSVEPRDASRFYGTDAVTQACVQVRGIAKDIAEDCSKIGSDRLFSADYRTMCDEPLRTMKDFRSFMARRGVELQERLSLPLASSTVAVRPQATNERAVIVEKLLEVDALL